MDWVDMAGQEGTFTFVGSGNFPHSDMQCPFCQRVGGFSSVNQIERPGGAGRTVFNELLVCKNCGNPVFFTGDRVRRSDANYDWRYTIYPKRKVEDAPHESWPASTSTYFVQSKRALSTQSWDAAAIMSRTVLQSIMRDFRAEGGTLNNEINDLVEKRIIVTALADWANHIRLISNAVVHPDPSEPTASEVDARDLVRFTEYFLNYVYTIPWEIANQKNRNPNA